METRAKTNRISWLFGSRRFLWLLWVAGGCLWMVSLLNLTETPIPKSAARQGTISAQCMERGAIVVPGRQP